MSDETTLLPCPFCGDKPLEPLSKRWACCLGDVSYSAYVECLNCGLTLETKSIGYKTPDEAKSAAVKEWNIRAERKDEK